MRRAHAVAGVVLTAASIVALIFVRGPGAADSPVDAAIDHLGYRPFTGRLAGSIWAPPPPSQQAGSTSATDRRFLLSAAVKLRGSAEEDDRALGSLLAGEASDAVLRLRALAVDRPSARIWNDLAVAQHALAERDVEGLCEAFAATERALDLDPAMPEARFNQALILESLALSRAAAKAYAAYLAIDTTSPWAAEARRRLAPIESRPTRRQAWRQILPDLRRAAAANETRTIIDAVAAAPQEARTWGETEILGDWADASLRGDDAAARVHLALARTIAGALHTRGESLLYDSVAAIDDAARNGDRPRLGALVRAHSVYRRSRIHYHSRDVARASAGFREARQLFDESRSPMAIVVQYYIGNAAIDAGNPAAAMEAALDVERRGSRRYAALRALGQWLRGALYGIDGVYDEMLRSYESAYRGFVALGEEQNASHLLDLMAATQSLLGRPELAWRLRRETFAIADASGIPQRLELALYGAATDAARAQQWDVAHALLGLTADVEGGNPRLQTEAAAWRALAAVRAGMHGSAATDLDAARRFAARIPDVEFRNDAEHEIFFVEAMLHRDADPSRAVSLLSRYIDRVGTRAAAPRLPRALEERASVLVKLGRVADAKVDLERAIARIEQQRAAIIRNDLRDSFLGIAGSAYDQLAELLDSEGDAAGAIAASDRRRARSIVDRTTETATYFTVNTLRSLPNDTVMVSYGQYGSRTVMYILTANGIARHPIALTREQIEDLARRFVGAVSRRNVASAQTTARRLHELLIAPAGSQVKQARCVVFVADGALQQIPFAALIAADGSYLIERHSVVVAPSVAGVLRPRVNATSRGTVLTVGNPRVDTIRFPTLANLAGAEQEARAVASLYPRAYALTAGQATETAFRAAVANAEIVDVAAHGVVQLHDPRMSRLVFASDERNDGVLTAAEIAALRIDARVVVLAGCRTAVPGRGYGDVRSVRAAFLAAGARSVVAALWDVDDSTTRDLSIAFHQALRSGASPAEALRSAQLALLRSGDPLMAQPRAWAALQLYGFDD